jgi:E3 ubiquitin-protein ligase HOS1
VLLPEVVSPNIHPKIARVFLERSRPDIALDVLNSSGRDGGLQPVNGSSYFEVPSLIDAVTAVRVRLECGLLTEAYLYQRSYISRVMTKAAIMKTKPNGEDDHRDWYLEMEVLVGEICWLCVRKNLLNKMIELPWQENEERILFNCLIEQATQDPCSPAGSLLIIYYMLVRKHLSSACQLELTDFTVKVFTMC